MSPLSSHASLVLHCYAAQLPVAWKWLRNLFRFLRTHRDARGPGAEVPRIDPTNPFSKQVRAILHVSLGHFQGIQSFPKQLDLSILSDQACKKELLDGSSRFG